MRKILTHLSIIFFTELAYAQHGGFSENEDWTNPGRESQVNTSHTKAGFSTGIYLCSNQPLPEGWIVINIVGYCDTGTAKQEIYQIKSSDKILSFVCGNPQRKFPEGWIVTLYYNGNCGDFAYPRYDIERVNSGTPIYICNVSHASIPKNWVVTEVAGGCFLPNYNRYRIEEAQTSRVIMTMCQVPGNSTIPENWVVTQIQAGCYMPGYAKWTIQPVVTDGTHMDICGVVGTQLPKNWVITEVAQGCYIPGYGKYRIKEARPSDKILQICNMTPIPEKWMITNQTNGCMIPGNSGKLTINHMP